MSLYAPSYVPRFRCLGPQCPHSCCEGWEVLIDPSTAGFYAAVPGELGQRLRAALRRDGEELCFPLHGGRCPFWEPSGLCEIHRRLGEEHTSFICRTHPRFLDDYGARRELTLGASCPEVVRLVLEEDGELLPQPETLWREPGEPSEETPELLNPLLLGRKTALDLLRRPGPMAGRLWGVALLANDLQALVDQGEETRSADVCDAWATEPLPEAPAEDETAAREAWETLLAQLSSLEILGEDWRALLTAAREGLQQGSLSLHSPQETQTRRTAEYFLLRHWLHGVWDGDVLSQAELAVLGTAAAALLGNFTSFPEALRLFCREMEHCQENLDALQEAFWGSIGLDTFQAALSLPGLLL